VDKSNKMIDSIIKVDTSEIRIGYWLKINN